MVRVRRMVWMIGREMEDSSPASVMIMAVLFRLTPAAALAIALTGCGGDKTPSIASEPLPGPSQSSPAHAPEPADSRPVIAAFGDSISAGFGLDPGQSYPDDLQRLVDAAGYRYRVVNMGVSGDTTTDGVERLPSVLALKPAIVILEFGGNDGLRGQPVSGAQQNLARMIESLRAVGASVVLAGMTLPRNYGPDYIHAFEQMYVDLALQFSLPRIPFLLEGVGGVASLTQPDGIHPTAAGARIVARTAMKYLQPQLKK
jgi:acyl-CoA thioesterase-1